MGLIYRENYWDDANSKQAINLFLRRVFNFDLAVWDDHGYWDTDFRPFSFFDGDSIAANVCIYSLDMMVDGARRRVAQVSSVGTLPEYRRQGLNSRLHEKALAWAQENHDFLFLFSDEEARPLYRKFGFRPVDEHKAIIDVSGHAPKPGIRRLDMASQKDRDFAFECARNRAAASDLLGVLNEKLFMFWCLYFLRDGIYHIEDLDVLVLYDRKENLVTINDVVGPEIPPFDDIYPYICDPSDATVEFQFMADKMNLTGIKEVKLDGNNGTHVLGDFPLDGRTFIFPLTCHA